MASNGDKLGLYRIIRHLGRGGMGEVFEVEHEVLLKRYALKLLPEDFAERPGALERFKREARAMATLDHPNIVKVDEFGETPSTGSGEAPRYWLRMELAEGVPRAEVRGRKSEPTACHVRSLAEYAEARGGRLEPDEAEVIFTQILEGLAHAHKHGVVHRDLKPENILLFGAGEDERPTSNVQHPTSKKTRNPEPGTSKPSMTAKISDFGLVLMVGEEWVRSQADLSIRLSMSLGQMNTEVGSADQAGTSTRSMLGTYEYMSPEQKRGEEATAASDVYAVGLMMYRLLTGRTQLGRKGISDIVAGAPGWWDDLVDKAVEDDASLRFADAGEMLTALPSRPAESAPSRSPSAAAPRRSSPPPAPSSVSAMQAILDIGSEPPGAEVILDGGERKVEAPCTIEKFPVGEHHYRAVLDGEKISGRFTVADYEHRLELRFEQALSRRGKAAAEAAAELKRFGEIRTVDLGGGFSMELVYIPAGTFMMGSPETEEERNDCETQHRVTLTKGFYMGKYPVTQAQWEQVMGNNPSHFKAGRILGFGGRTQPDHPVERVSWDDCQAFIKKLNAAAPHEPEVFRLPTEAEWEYAARGGPSASSGQGYKYSGSNSIDDVAWYNINFWSKTHPVGLKQPNELGLYDMSGNVWEWCYDWYGTYSSGAVTDPTGAKAGTCRVYRGGSWFNNASCCRAADRGGWYPTCMDGCLGFRVVLAPAVARKS